MFTPLTPVRCLHRAMDLYGHKEGVVCGDNRFTYAEFGERCEKLATALEGAGVESRDRVAYLSFNTHKLLEGYFGVVQMGAIVMPLNMRLTAAELTVILNHSGASFLFYEKDFAAMIPQFRADCPQIKTYLSLEEEYEPFLQTGHAGRKDIYTIGENAIAEVFYTSGSTGTPKGVALSHRTLYLHALSVSSVFMQTDTGVQLHTIPLFHANGWGCAQASTMMGAKHVMVRRFDPVTVFRLIEKELATSMLLVPAMANALLNSPQLGDYNFSSLREIHMGGAASTPELIDRVEQAFGCQCMAGYGLTETAPVAASGRTKGTVQGAGEEDRLRRQAMAGWPVPGVEIRVVDPEMRDVARDSSAIGEIVIRGDHVMEGYFNEPEATEAVMSGGWFHTGDMAVWDAETYVHIVDRKKDIIISGGENISSLEVEAAIAAHAAVMECAVVAAPDKKWGEIPVAFIVTKSALDQQQLSDFLQAKIAKFKIPRKFLFVEGPLPKTGSGKILKRELKKEFWAGREIQVQG